ncbi:O-antigen ligase family protein [Pseudovibrio ascidiaceicola]|uniref:O-antigen ligase family protein n=1 Tax=Pseudovibrio ascidiaceicola TaxID=285279 RepID=UPI003D36BD66
MTLSTSKIAIFCAWLATVAAGLTKTLSPPGHGIGGRVSIGDLILILLIGLAFLMIMRNRGRIRITRHYLSILPLFAVFFISGTFADDQQGAYIELCVHIFAVLFSLALLNLMPTKMDVTFARQLTKAILFGSFLLALYGIIVLFFFPYLNPVVGGLAGSFRNTGQAGNYFLAFSTIGLAAILSGLIPRTFLNASMVLTLLLALILTGKRASLLGLIVGFLLLLLVLMVVSRKSSDARVGSMFVISSIVIGVVVFFVISFSLSTVEGAMWRFEAKFTKSGLENFSSGFYFSNLLAGFAAFSDRPILGVGLGNIEGIYHEFEIHSTYVALLATSGVVGFLGYFFFLYHIMRSVFILRWNNEMERFLVFFFPFIIGQAGAWMYTYTVRKREFWITMFLLAVFSVIRRQLYRNTIP